MMALFNLQEKLTELRNKSEKENPDLTNKNRQSIVELKRAKVSEKSIKIGEKMPDFILPNSSNQMTTLNELTQNCNIIVNFYRGNWCPYCKMELMALKKYFAEFKKFNGKIIAIAPENPQQSVQTVEEFDLPFDVLSDTDNKLAKQIGIAYAIPEYLLKVYEKYGLDISKHNSSDKFELPLPATYVLDKEGVVRYTFVTPDYTIRANMEDILDVLQEIEN